jgi:hypothetical protein
MKPTDFYKSAQPHEFICNADMDIAIRVYNAKNDDEARKTRGRLFQVHQKTEESAARFEVGDEGD